MDGDLPAGFGFLIFAPDANQVPPLGIFVIGPAGAALGRGDWRTGLVEAVQLIYSTRILRKAANVMAVWLRANVPVDRARDNKLACALSAAFP